MSLTKIDYFFAEWCGPCNRMSRLSRKIERLCDKYNVEFVKHACPLEKDEREDFQKEMDKYSFQKIPSFVLHFDCDTFKSYHDMTEIKYHQLIVYIESLLISEEEVDEF